MIQTVEIGGPGQGGEVEKSMGVDKSLGNESTFAPLLAGVTIPKNKASDVSAENSPRSSPVAPESPDSKKRIIVEEKMLEILSECPGYDADRCRSFVDKLMEMLFALASTESKEKVKTLLINLKVRVDSR